jgi:hypothetical protein
MAFPVIESSAYSESTVNTGSINATAPSGIASGDLLIAIAACDGNRSFVWDTGWVELADNSGSRGCTLAAAYKDAGGSEPSTYLVDNAGTERVACWIFRISGAEDPSTQAPEIAAANGGAATSIDPPSLTPTGGAADFLWIAFGCMDVDGNNSISTYPSGYTNTSYNETGTTTGHVLLVKATLDSNTATEDPGAFTVSLSDTWNAATIAVHPGAAASGSLLGVNLIGEGGLISRGGGMVGQGGGLIG